MDRACTTRLTTRLAEEFTTVDRDRILADVELWVRALRPGLQTSEMLERVVERQVRMGLRVHTGGTPA